MGIVYGLCNKIQGEEIAEAREISHHFVLTRQTDHHLGNVNAGFNKLIDHFGKKG